MIDWTQTFCEGRFLRNHKDAFFQFIDLSTISELKVFLDEVHIRDTLVRAYCQHKAYPLVDSRDLLPSFEVEPWEYKELPGFSLVAFGRHLNSFNERFQYDIIHPVLDAVNQAEGASCPLENQVITRNTQTLLARLPKKMQEAFREQFKRIDVSLLEHYATLLPYLLVMDRAQVMACDSAGKFYLAGIFASFPSDFDGELKRFGLRIGKFRPGDSEMYERNRQFVWQFLMELYGFPVASERRTSAAVFARHLHKVGERFLIRVLGQSDRVITTIWNDGGQHHYPIVEKIALTQIDHEEEDLIKTLDEQGFFVDTARRVVILRVKYKQHRFSKDNVRQDRALSVIAQEVIHPLNGTSFATNVIRDASTLVLRLNDIVRGEYIGRVVYKRTEIIENTDTTEKKLKFLYAWLAKHQRRIIGYSDDFYTQVTRVLDSYLRQSSDDFIEHNELLQEIEVKYAYIRQARQVRYLEDIAERSYRGERLGYARMLREAVKLLHDLKFDLANYFDSLVENILHNVQRILDDRYLLKKYVHADENTLSKQGVEVRKNYRKLVSLHDEFRLMRKSRVNIKG